jgi:hypothetical protein
VPRSHAERLAIRDSVAFVGRLSDSLVKIGPFSLGLDGVLAWAPGIGELYSTLAGAFIVVQGARAGVPLPTLAAAGLLLALRTLATAVPLAGDVFADLFTAHKWAAAKIVRAIDREMGPAAAASQVSGAADRRSWQGSADATPSARPS